MNEISTSQTCLYSITYQNATEFIQQPIVLQRVFGCCSISQNISATIGRVFQLYHHSICTLEGNTGEMVVMSHVVSHAVSGRQRVDTRRAALDEEPGGPFSGIAHPGARSQNSYKAVPM